MELVLEINQSDDNMLLTEFSFNAMQIMEIEDFCRDLVAMSFYRYSSTMVLLKMRGISFLPGMGLEWCQHGPREFTLVMDHDSSFRFGYILIQIDFRYMTRLCKEMVMARLSCTVF